MKKLERLKLHNLSQAEMAKREQNLLKGGGGYSCGCGTYCPCLYYGPQTDKYDSYYGGSSTTDNENANGTNSFKSIQSAN